jgi:hypothetical protein
LPDPPAISDPTVISNAADYAGVFSSGTKSFELVATGNRLTLKHNGGAVPLLRVQGDTFRVASGGLSKFFFVFARDSGKVTEVSWGPDWYTAPAYTGPKKFDTPSEYAAYTGRYVNHNPEESIIRIYVRKGQLFVALVPALASDWYLPVPPVSDPRSPTSTPRDIPSTPSSKVAPSGSSLPGCQCTAWKSKPQGFCEIWERSTQLASH